MSTKLLSIRFVPGACLQIGLQFLFECFTPAVNEGFCRGQRAAEHFGDFLVTQFILAAKQDGKTLVFRQPGQGLFDLLLQFAVQEAVGCRGYSLVFKLVQRLVFVLRVGRVHRIHRMPRTAPDFVQAQVPRDGE